MDVESAPEPASPWRAALCGALSAALAVVLLAKAVETHGRNAELQRRVRATGFELERIRNDQTRMRAELKALNEDPIYLDAVLNRPPVGRSQEPLIETPKGGKK